MQIKFLSMPEGKDAILDESLEPYFSQLQKREIETFISEILPTENIIESREFAKERFASAVIPFSDDEKKCISFVLKEATRILRQNNIDLFCNCPWNLIKIEDWLCGGFAHTRSDSIIISRRHIDHLSKGWSDNMSREEKTNLAKVFGSLLLHEQMHVLQRRQKSKFTKLYAEHWGFINATVITEQSIQMNQVSNPDAPIAEWLIPAPNQPELYYWIKTLLRETEGVPVMGKDFIDMVFVVHETEKGFEVEKDCLGKPISVDFSEISFHTDSFPTQKGLDHPNEISAYMFADYFASLITKTKPFESVSKAAASNTKHFLNWINNA